MTNKSINTLLRWLTYIVAMLVVATSILLYKQDYSLRGFSNALFIPGAVLLFVFLLKLLKNKGAFDIITYAGSRLVHGLRNKTVGEFKEAHEYIEDKRIERKKQTFYYLPEITVATLFIVVATILAFLYKWSE